MQNIKIQGLKEINRTLKAIDKSLYPQLIKDITHDAYDNVRERAKKHYVTGNMENNINFKVDAHSLSGAVFIEDNAMMVDVKGKSVNYALFVLFGTKPHSIKPKDKKALRFTSVNQFVFAKGVEHPGYKGDNFLEDGVQDTFKKIDKLFQGVQSEYN